HPILLPFPTRRSSDLYALAYPERVDAAAANLHFDLAALSQLDFSTPDLARFPCLRLAYEAAAVGGNACIALNAADEVAVAAFLRSEEHTSELQSLRHL